MPHHEESPEKPQYNMATPPFLDKPPFSSKNFQTPPISISFEKVKPPPLYEGGGSKLCSQCHWHAHVTSFKCSISD